MLNETAYAKINLALHVRRRREDGYHELETLFAFVNDGDRLSAVPADRDSLTIEGEFAGGLSAGADNLVLQALAKMRQLAWPGHEPPPLAVRLEKRLPVAAGLGGGSADAGAMIRLLERAFVHNGDNREIVLATRSLGADVGACVVSQTRLGLGNGSDLQMPGANDASGLPVLLINPRVPLATGPVFSAWNGIDMGPLPPGTVLAAALAGRNDLEAPAIALCPPIAEVLAGLRETAPFLARMSGSGATCFALYASSEEMRSAAEKLARERPEWWQMAGKLR